MNKVSLNSNEPLLTTIILMKGIVVCVAVYTFHQYNKKGLTLLPPSTSSRIHREKTNLCRSKAVE